MQHQVCGTVPAKDVQPEPCHKEPSDRGRLGGSVSLTGVRLVESVSLTGGVSPTPAQVMISRLVGSSPTSGSVLTARGLEPASDSGSPLLSAPPLLMLSLCVKNKH